MNARFNPIQAKKSDYVFVVLKICVSVSVKCAHFVIMCFKPGRFRFQVFMRTYGAFRTNACTSASLFGFGGWM